MIFHTRVVVVTGKLSIWANKELTILLPIDVLLLLYIGSTVILSIWQYLDGMCDWWQVYGDEEWSFGYCEQGTGVFSCPPSKNPMYTYRECIVLGKTDFSIYKVNQILRELSREWPGCSYDLLSKNCNHFCDEFCEKLGVSKLPGNVHLSLSLSQCLDVPIWRFLFLYALLLHSSHCK